jgi:hypothetical protein
MGKCTTIPSSPRLYGLCSLCSCPLPSKILVRSTKMPGIMDEDSRKRLARERWEKQVGYSTKGIPKVPTKGLCHRSLIGLTTKEINHWGVDHGGESALPHDIGVAWYAQTGLLSYLEKFYGFKGTLGTEINISPSQLKDLKRILGIAVEDLDESQEE